MSAHVRTPFDGRISVSRRVTTQVAGETNRVRVFMLLTIRHSYQRREWGRREANGDSNTQIGKMRNRKHDPRKGLEA
jgi:hypothetical protein